MSRFELRLLPALAAALLIAGCAAGGPSRPRRGEAMAATPRLFVSPAGQVFRGAPGEPPPIAAWFRQADADGDGALGFAEFQADFRAYFAALDGDGDGEIGPAETVRYETEILPEMASMRGFGGGVGNGGRRGGIGRGERGGGSPGAGRGRGRGGQARAAPAAAMSGAARFGLLPIPHPIMSADLDFNRGVSRDEFDRAAATRFNLLDEAHVGRLSLAGLVARRRQRPGRQR